MPAINLMGLTKIRDEPEQINPKIGLIVVDLQPLPFVVNNRM
jgi:hypothetical protein